MILGIELKFGWPGAFILRRPSSSASYSVLLFLLWSRSLNFSLAAYLILVPEGDSMIAEISVPSLHQAPLQYIT